MKKILLLLLFCQLGCSLSLFAQDDKPKTDRRVKGSALMVSNTLDREVEAHLKAWYKDYAKHDNRAGAKKKGSMSIQQPDSVYARMLSEIPSVLTFSYNAKIKEAIQLYLGKRSRLIRSMLSLAEVYFPEMEVILDKNNMPYELKYLSIVESALKPSAGSRAGAKGLWQFMAPTAKIQGLEVNSLVDERYEVEASTEAACRYLTTLHDMYDDWFLAIAAYNCGPGNVNKAIKRAGNSRQFWDIYPYLPRETQNYIPLFVGVYFAMYYHQEFGIEPRPMEMIKTIDYFDLDKKVSLAQVARLSGTPLDEVKTLNPQFKRGIVPAHRRTYQIRLPFASVMRLEENYDKLDELSLIEYNKVKTRYKYPKKKSKRRRVYKVRRGDTLGAIARRHRTSVSKLKRWNHLRSSRIRIGQRLVIY